MRKAGGRLLSPVFEPETPEYLSGYPTPRMRLVPISPAPTKLSTHVREALDNSRASRGGAECCRLCAVVAGARED